MAHHYDEGCSWERISKEPVYCAFCGREEWGTYYAPAEWHNERHVIEEHQDKLFTRKRPNATESNITTTT